MTNNNIHVIESCIIPLVKNRCGDLTDQDNYRRVALVNILSKVFELALLSMLKKFYGVRTTNLDSKLVIQLKCVYIYYMNVLISIGGIILQHLLLFLMLVKHSTRLITGNYIISETY